MPQSQCSCWYSEQVLLLTYFYSLLISELDPHFNDYYKNHYRVYTLVPSLPINMSAEDCKLKLQHISEFYKSISKHKKLHCVGINFSWASQLNCDTCMLIAILYTICVTSCFSEHSLSELERLSTQWVIFDSLHWYYSTSITTIDTSSVFSQFSNYPSSMMISNVKYSIQLKNKHIFFR